MSTGSFCEARLLAGSSFPGQAGQEVLSILLRTLWERVEPKIEVFLAHRNVARHSRIWGWIERFFPAAAYRIAMTRELNLPGNILFWPFDPSTDQVINPDELESCLGWLADRLTHAPAPGGFDEYKIVVSTFAAPAPEFPPLDSDYDATMAALPQLRMVDSQVVSGDRYYDWRRGDAPAQVRDLLRRSRAHPQCFLTCLQFAVEGAAYAHALRRTTPLLGAAR